MFVDDEIITQTCHLHHWLCHHALLLVGLRLFSNLPWILSEPHTTVNVNHLSGVNCLQHLLTVGGLLVLLLE